METVDNYKKIKSRRDKVEKRKMRRANTQFSGLTNPGVIMPIHNTEDYISSSDESDGDSYESEIHDIQPKKRCSKLEELSKEEKSNLETKKNTR